MISYNAPQYHSKSRVLNLAIGHCNFAPKYFSVILSPINNLTIFQISWRLSCNCISLPITVKLCLACNYLVVRIVSQWQPLWGLSSQPIGYKHLWRALTNWAFGTDIKYWVFEPWVQVYLSMKLIFIDSILT